MKTEDLFQGYAFPKTSEQEVLLTLILQGYVSLFDFPVMSGFRTRISELKLKYGLNLDRKTETRCNKFSNEYRYSIHFLPESEKQKAIELYNKLNKKHD